MRDAYIKVAGDKFELSLDIQHLGCLQLCFGISQDIGPDEDCPDAQLRVR